MLHRIYQNIITLNKWTRNDAIIIDELTDGSLSESINIMGIPEMHSTVNLKFGVRALQRTLGLKQDIVVHKLKEILKVYDDLDLEFFKSYKEDKTKTNIEIPVGDTGIFTTTNILDEPIPDLFINMQDVDRNFIAIAKQIEIYGLPIFTLDISNIPKTLRDIIAYFRSVGIGEYKSLYNIVNAKIELAEDPENILYLKDKVSLFIKVLENPVTKTIIEFLKTVSK